MSSDQLWTLLIAETKIWTEQLLSRSENRSRTQYIEGIYNNPVTLKYSLRVIQHHWKWNHCIDHARLTIGRAIWHWMLMWPSNVGQRSLKVIENGTIRKLGYGFLFTFHSNCGISLAISEIFSIKEWPDFEIWVWGRSRSLKLVLFDRTCTTFYWSAIVTIAL